MDEFHSGIFLAFEFAQDGRIENEYRLNFLIFFQCMVKSRIIG
jgi:hypothetical protein